MLMQHRHFTNTPHSYCGGPIRAGAGMAEATDFGRLLVALRGGGDRVLILVEDSEAEAGWWIVTEADLAESARSLESITAESAGLPARLCYNVEEAAKSVGVSVRKFNTWIRRAEQPVPHIRDGRRILIPIHLLVQWLAEEAARNGGQGEGAI